MGGVSETPVRGSQLGPTFTCLIARQFAEIKNGDRFYFSFNSSGFDRGE